MTEIDITVLTAANLYMAKVVVEHGSTLIDKGIEMISCEDIALWVEEDRGRCTL